jgi:hypothetical protein
LPCRRAQNENSLLPCGDGFVTPQQIQENAMAKGQEKPKEKKKPKAETSKKGTSSYKQAYGK